MSRILVTGASAGLGLLTAQALTQAGHQVIAHVRNRRRTEDPAVQEAASSFIYGDLGDLDETSNVAEQANQFGTFDAVIQNAGILDGPDLTTVNVVAPFILAALMERPARMIVLSSSMHRGGSALHVAEAIAGRRQISYGDSKLYVTALAMAITTSWPAALVHAVDPGWVPTRMGGASATDDLTLGHRTQEWIATVPESQIRPRTGGYWHHSRALSPHPATLKPSFQDELIDSLQQRTGISLR